MYGAVSSLTSLTDASASAHSPEDTAGAAAGLPPDVALEWLDITLELPEEALELPEDVAELQPTSSKADTPITAEDKIAAGVVLY
jgi:hypothetical protein